MRYSYLDLYKYSLDVIKILAWLGLHKIIILIYAYYSMLEGEIIIYCITINT